MNSEPSGTKKKIDKRQKQGLLESEEKAQWMQDEASRRGIDVAELQRQLDDE